VLQRMRDLAVEKQISHVASVFDGLLRIERGEMPKPKELLTLAFEHFLAHASEGRKKAMIRLLDKEIREITTAEREIHDVAVQLLREEARPVKPWRKRAVEGAQRKS
jgi:hypothetical protein